tara:strand:+ start:21183 stop:23255 length:2073 start_codon:yes stop_codon:yes gene_type:complete
MKKLLFILYFLPMIGFGQINIGSNHTICLADSVQLIAVSSGPASACTGAIDSLTSLANGSSNGSAGTMFNVINNSGGDITINGFSQGTYSYSGAINMDIWYYPGDYLPVMTSNTGWTQVATAVSINLPSGATATNPLYSAKISITPVVIPAGATYGFYVGGNTTVSYSTATAGSIAGITACGSNNLLTITTGHGGNFPNPVNNPRDPLIKIHYGAGASWFDASTGQNIGSGDSIYVSPSQTTDICAVLECNGIIYSDTVTVNVLNTGINSSGISLCSGPLVLSVANSFSSYLWNGGLTSSSITVSSPGTYFVTCTNANGQTCQSPPVQIYQNTIPVSLSTSDSVFICQGDTVLIEGPVGFNQYLWSNGATTSSILTTQTGNYSLTVTDGNGCTGSSGNTTIEISPQNIITTTTGLSLCNGSVTLSAPSGFTSYQWFNNGVMQWLGTQQNFVTTNAGNYHCEVVYPTGCSASSINSPLAIVPGTGAFNVNITTFGDSLLCNPFGQVVLDAGNYSSFLWSTGETSQQIMVDSLGTFTVDVIDSSGCNGSSSQGFTVYNAVNTSAINGNQYPVQFQQNTYSVSATAGSIYNWIISNSANIISGANTNAITIEFGFGAFGDKNVKVIETNADGCVGDTISFPIFVFVSSNNELTINSRLIKIVDVNGIDSGIIKNKPLFFFYENGIVEKRIIIE